MRAECLRSRAQKEVLPESTPVASTMSLQSVCLAPCTTLLQIPPALLEEWISLFVQELRAFATAPAEETLLRVFMCSKVLLAQPFHGGKTKAAAVERIVQRRIARWRAGQIQQLWDDMDVAWASRRQRRRSVKTETAEMEREFRKVVALVNQGLPGKACRLLCSRGIAEGPEVKAEMCRLFPSIHEIVEPRTEERVEVDLKLMQWTGARSLRTSS